MRLSDLEHYICRDCGAEELLCQIAQGQQLSGIEDGIIRCNGCGTEYSVVKGIPRFVPLENYASSFGYQWNVHRETQLDSNTGLPISRNRVFAVTGWPECLDGQAILEAGSGAGRFTEVLLGSGADVFSFDFSNAVEANCANNGNNPHLHLFQGDIFRVPLRKSSFDKVFCLGVLQHTPDPARAFKSLAEFVRPGGELVIDVYTKSFQHLCQWKYLLRPLTKRMNKELLYKIISTIVPKLIPIAKLFRRFGGKYGARLLPFVEYSRLGLPKYLNEQWAILDTFDMFSPMHDHPQTVATVNNWFKDAGFEDVKVDYGPNGVIGKGKKPMKNRDYSGK